MGHLYAQVRDVDSSEWCGMGEMERTEWIWGIL